MSTRKLLEFYETRRAAGEALALATVVETRGSTYSKAGAHMLIDENGIFRGMLSGGCLEGDLAIRAAAVLESGRPQIATYDLSHENEELWGLGVGCDGLMRVLLQPMTPGGGYQPFEAIAAVLRGDAAALAAIVVESALAEVPAGAAVVAGASGVSGYGVGIDWRDRLYRAAATATAAGRTATAAIEAGTSRVTLLAVVLRPPPRLLVMGAGLDAEPVVRFATELGWRTTVTDHRPAYVSQGDFAGAEATLSVPAAELAQALDLSRFDLALVMSHHLASDRSYLELLASTEIPYIGLLGPPHRRQRLLEDLGRAASRLDRRLHGPAGLDIGGRGPAAIALSIIAEMQQALCRRTPKPHREETRG